jgi:hypothetical protein
LVYPADFIDPTLKPGSSIYDSTQCIAWQPVVDIGGHFYLTKPNQLCTPVSASDFITSPPKNLKSWFGTNLVIASFIL